MTKSAPLLPHLSTSESSSIGTQAYLLPEQLDQLTLSWDIWAQSASSQSRVIARARLHLVFLLARYGGLRLAEIFSLNIQRDLNREAAMLRISGSHPRNIFLPPAAMRKIRRIISLADAEEKNFLQVDAGLIRRTFYTVAQPLELERSLCGPRAIRYARGLELLQTHMPCNLVYGFLGLNSPVQQAIFFQNGHKNSKKHEEANCFGGIVSNVNTGLRATAIELATFSGLHLISTCYNNERMEFEPFLGQVAYARIMANQVYFAGEPVQLTAANIFPGRIVSIYQDMIESFVRLELGSGDQLAAEVDTCAFNRLRIEKDKDVFVFFPAHAVQIRQN